MINCTRCGREVGPCYVIVEGLLGTYAECSDCYNGIKPTPGPELLTDTFTTAPAPPARGLDAILDKLTGTSG